MSEDESWRPLAAQCVASRQRGKPFAAATPNRSFRTPMATPNEANVQPVFAMQRAAVLVEPTSAVCAINTPRDQRDVISQFLGQTALEKSDMVAFNIVSAMTSSSRPISLTSDARALGYAGSEFFIRRDQDTLRVPSSVSRTSPSAYFRSSQPIAQSEAYFSRRSRHK